MRTDIHINIFDLRNRIHMFENLTKLKLSLLKKKHVYFLINNVARVKKNIS